MIEDFTLSSGDFPQGSSESGADEESSVACHEIRGEVEKVLYTSADETYSVIRVRDFQGKDHSVVGSLPGVCEGEIIEVRGKWEMHREHGRQFRAESCRFSLPATEQGIIRYLSSGIIPGVGEKYARAIVHTFGLETLSVLDNATPRLKEVPGLGRKRIAGIKKAWKENSGKRNLQIFMQGLGISPAFFNRIYSVYGDRCAEVVRKNPYQLCFDVRGIGFLMADRIAGNLGIAKNDPQRLIFGVKHSLEQAKTAGHVCMPRDAFADQAAAMLGVSFEETMESVKAAVHQGFLAEGKAPDGSVYLYEPGMLQAENELPHLIMNLLKREKHFGQLLASSGMQGTDAKFSREQLDAIEQAGRSAVSILTGGPGVGKTTVVAEIVRRAKKAKLHFVLAAPTGRAAKRMQEATGENAQTIHRLLKWDPAKGCFIHGAGNFLHEQLFIIDEASMLDLPLADAFFKAVPPGACVMLVGDPDQLPSVGPGNVLNDLIDSGICPVSRLTKIFRQGEGSGIIRAAHAVNGGSLPDYSGNAAGDRALSDFYWLEKEVAEETANLIVRLVTDRIPRRFHLNPMTEIQVLCPMNRGPAGTIALNERLQKVLNPEQEEVFRYGGRLFKKGDKVMQISNNYDKNVFNGDMGHIESIDVAGETFTVRFDQELIAYSFEDSEQLVLAYAVTVHKSQGSEFPAVVMPLLGSHYKMLQRNLLYTGMTRARKLMILAGSRKAVSMAVRNAVREPRYSLLYEKLKDAAEEK